MELFNAVLVAEVSATHQGMILHNVYFSKQSAAKLSELHLAVVMFLLPNQLSTFSCTSADLFDDMSVLSYVGYLGPTFGVHWDHHTWSQS